MEVLEEALGQLRHMPFEDLGFAKVDHHRALRRGMPEVILRQGKTPEQVAEIAARLGDKSSNVLVTRADARTAELVKARVVVVCAGIEGALPSVVGDRPGADYVASPINRL